MHVLAFAWVVFLAPELESGFYVDTHVIGVGREITQEACQSAVRAILSEWPDLKPISANCWAEDISPADSEKTPSRKL